MGCGASVPVPKLFNSRVRFQGLGFMEMLQGFSTLTMDKNMEKKAEH